MSERSEFAAFPLTGAGFWGPEGQPPRGRLFLGYFFLAKQKEGTACRSGCRAAPGLVMAEHLKNKQPQHGNWMASASNPQAGSV
jgi:hypothetical protein